MIYILNSLQFFTYALRYKDILFFYHFNIIIYIIYNRNIYNLKESSTIYEVNLKEPSTIYEVNLKESSTIYEVLYMKYYI